MVAQPIELGATGGEELGRLLGAHFSPTSIFVIFSCRFLPLGSTISGGGDGRFLHGAWTPPDWLQLGADLRSAFGVKARERQTEALAAGVDDFLTKPFLNAELVARIEAVLRRTQGKEADVDRLIVPETDLIIDFRTQEILHCGQRMQLTGREFSIMALLARSAPAIVAYHDIAVKIWDEDSAEARNRIKYLVHLLRRKFQKLPGTPDFIENVDRLGYKLRTTFVS